MKALNCLKFISHNGLLEDTTFESCVNLTYIYFSSCSDRKNVLLLDHYFLSFYINQDDDCTRALQVLKKRKVNLFDYKVIIFSTLEQSHYTTFVVINPDLIKVY
jgi:hypothetical protein